MNVFCIVYQNVFQFVFVYRNSLAESSNVKKQDLGEAKVVPVTVLQETLLIGGISEMIVGSEMTDEVAGVMISVAVMTSETEISVAGMTETSAEMTGTFVVMTSVGAAVVAERGDTR